MIKADKIGGETYLSYVNDCLIKGKADFFDTIKKFKLGIGLKKAKKIRKTVSVMKRDRQAIGGNVGCRSEPRTGISVSYYISAIKVSIFRFDF